MTGEGGGGEGGLREAAGNAGVGRDSLCGSAAGAMTPGGRVRHGGGFPARTQH